VWSRDVTCDRIHRLVFLWIDRDREALPRERVERHFERCPECRERAHEVERVVLLVRSRCRRESVPAGLVERIRVCIQEE
jgi:anti-sigma factor (TIGR02949 family)